MGLDVYEAFDEAKEVYQEVDDVLQTNLSNIIFRGEASDLNLTAKLIPPVCTSQTHGSGRTNGTSSKPHFLIH